MRSRKPNRMGRYQVDRTVPTVAMIGFLTVVTSCAAATRQPEAAVQDSETTTANVNLDESNPSKADPGDTDQHALAPGLRCDTDNDSTRRQHDQTAVGLRPDLLASGNRLVVGSAALNFSTPVEIDLPEPARWVLAAPESDERSAPAWLVGLDSGAAVSVLEDGTTRALPTPPEGPPAVASGPSGPTLESLGSDRSWFTNPLADARVVSVEQWSATLVNPTDRYRHGVLGDDLEAAGVEVIDRCSHDRLLIEVEAPDVIEGLAPLLVGPSDSPTGDLMILVTVSNSNDGARLVLYDRSGQVVAESDPIGAGNRWRNQLAAGPIGPNGDFAVVDVRTPHIGGTVQWFAADLDTARLELISISEPIFTTHVIGSRNLDLGAAVDVDGDGQPEIVVPSAQRDRLVALQPGVGAGAVPTEATVIDQVELPGRMTTNLGVRRIDGTVNLAIGTDGSKLLIFRP